MTLYQRLYEKLKGSGIGTNQTVVKAKAFYVRNFGLTKKPMMINGHSMYIGKEDTLNLLVNKSYEPASTEFLMKNAKGIGCDIGANIGYYTLLMGGLCSKVYAFEPCSETFDVLKKNIELNKMNNVTAVKAAAGDKKETKQINHSWGGAGGNSFLDLGKWQGEKEDVEVLKLDDYFSGIQKPDIIKMDVEGWEEEAINGGIETFGHAKIILFENNEELLKKMGKGTDTVINMLKDMGFELEFNSENFIAKKH